MVKVNDKIDTVKNDIMISMIENYLETLTFTAEKFMEEDGSVNLALVEINDLLENGKTEEEAIKLMAAQILDFSEIFYKNFSYWSKGREHQIPYVLKALLLNDVEKIGGLITCHLGET